MSRQINYLTVLEKHLGPYEKDGILYSHRCPYAFKVSAAVGSETCRNCEYYLGSRKIYNISCNYELIQDAKPLYKSKNHFLNVFLAEDEFLKL